MSPEENRELLSNARHLAHGALEVLLAPGDTAVDATMGNGGDTALLCRLVGETGHVYAFDVQEQALVNTRARLEAEGLLARATLLQKGHERMAEDVPAGVRAVCFNLGWLPGGDHARTTLVQTTLAAADAALSLLAPGGLLSLCVYPGHREGKREREALLAWAGALPVRRYNALFHRFVNAGDDCPCLLLVQKNRAAGKEREKDAVSDHQG